jgi:UDP-N-acetylmuramoylalanine--D-glutamate ligase
MRLHDLQGKKVCIVGFGREGKAMFEAIQRHAPDTYVTMADKNPDAFKEIVTKLENEVPFAIKHGFHMHNGEKIWLREIDSFDVIVKSPGIPMNPELERVSAKITNSTQIFLEEAADRGAIVIGVTGSKGKSTTSSLIHHILKEAGKNTYLVGNIGEPAIAHVDDAMPGVIFVQEMSSYQLMHITVSPPIAVVTAFFPEHLDYHGTLDAYREAKTNIARFQRGSDAVFYDETSDGAAKIAAAGTGRKIPFRLEQAPVSIADTQLLGEHNLRNIAAAFLVTTSLGVDEETAMRAIRSFTPLHHRLELVSSAHGIRWVDDAISTTPESAIAALDALGVDVATMLLGGQDRGMDFAELGRRIAASEVKTVILFPETGTRIEKALREAGAKARMEHVETMQQAVTLALEHTSKGRTCLLSPASPSYNLHKNFEERGKAFKDEIEKQA